MASLQRALLLEWTLSRKLDGRLSLLEHTQFLNAIVLLQ
jgi:hypothetical protein